MNNSLEILDHVRLNFSPAGLFFLNIALAFVMFGVALDIKVDHFTNLIKKTNGPLPLKQGYTIRVWRWHCCSIPRYSHPKWSWEVWLSLLPGGVFGTSSVV